jgi:hypothetical protein
VLVGLEMVELCFCSGGGFCQGGGAEKSWFCSVLFLLVLLWVAVCEGQQE